LELSFTYSAWYLVLFLLIAIAASYFVYKTKKEQLPQWLFRTLSVCRALSIFGVLVLLLDPQLLSEKEIIEKPVFYLAVDNSKSVAIQMGDAVNQLPTQVEAVKAKLEEKYNVQQINFGADLDFTSIPKFADNKTNAAQVLDVFSERMGDERIAGALLFSDGVFNSGSNPIYKLGAVNFPIHTILTGDTTKYIDVAITEVLHNNNVFKGNATQINVRLRGQKTGGKQLQLSLYEGTKKLEQKPVSFSLNNEYQQHTFYVTPSKVGLVNYSIKATELQSENNLQNNVYPFTLDVSEAKTKVLVLYNGIHPDVAALVRSLENAKTYEVKTQFLQNTKAQLNETDIVVYYEAGKQNKTILAQLEKSNIPILFLNPTASTLNEIGIKIEEKGSNNIQPFLNNNFDRFIVEDLEDAFTEIPALQTVFGNYSLSPAWKNVYTQGVEGINSGNPLLVIAPSLQGGLAVCLGSGYWQWRMNVFSRTGSFSLFDKWVHKVVQSVSKANNKAPLQIEFQKQYVASEEINSNAFIQNSLGELVSGKEIKLALSLNDSILYDYTYTPIGNKYQLRLNGLPKGNYSWQASTVLNAKSEKQVGSFVISVLQLEEVNTSADVSTMQKIASNTNGKFVYLNELNNLLTEVTQNEQNSASLLRLEESKESWLDKWLILALILISFTAEWALRRNFGLS
jgi:hypothetical protein